eukprot:27091-Prorocentrum_minimum.AAC.1
MKAMCKIESKKGARAEAGRRAFGRGARCSSHKSSSEKSGGELNSSLVKGRIVLPLKNSVLPQIFYGRRVSVSTPNRKELLTARRFPGVVCTSLLNSDDTRELAKKPQIEARLAKLEAGDSKVHPGGTHHKNVRRQAKEIVTKGGASLPLLARGTGGPVKMKWY